MKTLSRILLVLIVSLVAGAAQAQTAGPTVNWNYAQAGFGSYNPDHGSREDGWIVGGSGALGKLPLHIFGQFGDFDRIDIWFAGAGWHGLLGERADLFADAAFYDMDVEDGLKARFGVRWMAGKAFELNGYIAWTDLDFSNNSSAAVHGIFDLGDLIGLGGGYEWGDNWSSGRVFIRFNFR